ncbi:MAG: IS1182 family transposase [Marinobacter sp.]
MTRAKAPIDNRAPETDLFGDAIPSKKQPAKPASVGSRKFINPDPTSIHIGLTPLEQHLRQAGCKDAFVVRELLQELDWSTFEQRYASTGRAPYAPMAMMGLILYGVMQGISSLRELERLARMDLGCMWVSGGITPDHANIGRFIVIHEESLSGDFFEELTRAVLKRCPSRSTRLAGDGTVVESAGSYYRLLKQQAAGDQARKARQAADANQGDPALERAAQQAEKAGDVLQQRLQARQAQGKNTDSVCVSATDPEAMMQPLKRGRGRAPSYKPSVLANEERIIVAMGLDPSHEAKVIGPMLDLSKRVLGEDPQSLMLDAGYFCNAIIKEALERDLDLLCPEGKQAGQAPESNHYYLKSQFQYLVDEDAYLCPNGQKLIPIGRCRGKTEAETYVRYGTKACGDCPLKAQCTRSETGRVIKRYASDEAKDAMRAVMQQPAAQRAFSKRQAMVEPVFSVMGLKQGLRRFRRRGLAGVKREFALHVLAYNLSRAVALFSLFFGQKYGVMGVIRAIQGFIIQMFRKEAVMLSRETQYWSPA